MQFQPLSVYFVWHPDDNKRVRPVVDYCYQLLSKNIDRPFSRSMNLPVFYRTSLNGEVPNVIKADSEKTIVFPIISSNLASDESWISYIKSISLNNNLVCIPIALDKAALSIGIDLGNTNFLRAYDFEQLFYENVFFISIAHEIFRFTLNENFSTGRIGKDNSLKLFISHAKDGGKGLRLALELKKHIDCSLMRNFFDATDIAPGYRFDDEIIQNIKESTVISIHSDIYSSRYWCQKEIICAKEFDRPIIAVDVLDDLEDRRFPHSSNIPYVHAHIDESVELKDVYRILTLALLETIRFNYSNIILDRYKSLGLVGPNTVILSRPPEAFDIRRTLTPEIHAGSKIKQQFLYPEPPLYSEELEYLKRIGLSFITPLEINSVSLNGKRVGLSISVPTEEDLIYQGIPIDLITQLSQELSRHFIARKAELIYGGDLRKGGITEFILEEARALNDRISSREVRVKNYIPWPIYLNDTQSIKEWKCKYRNIAEMIHCECPHDVQVLKQNSTDYDSLEIEFNMQNYMRARSLTEMRYMVIDNSDFRISAGGKQVDYTGRMPGVLEEVVIAIQKRKPIFLLGGFGGITTSICKMIKNNAIPEVLSQEWHLRNQEDYNILLDIYEKNGTWKDFEFTDLDQLLRLENLNNGLSNEDNLKLFDTKFIDEAIHLILKGIKNTIPVIKDGCS